MTLLLSQLAEVISRIDIPPVTVIPTSCVRLWPALQYWMTGVILTGLVYHHETEGEGIECVFMIIGGSQY